MKIAVISDTHLHEPDQWLEAVYEKYLAHADVLVHCGDTTGFSVWSFFNQHPDFHAVRGNMDEWRLSQELSERESFEAGGLKMGAVHGYGFGRIKAGISAALGADHDVVFFGHTHRREWAEQDGLMLLNPGSLKASAFLAGSMAYLHVDGDGRLEPEFVDVPSGL
jgi:putative phosphoesterase